MEHLITSELQKIKMSNNTSQHNVVTQCFFHISSLLFLCCIGSGEEKGVIFHDRISQSFYRPIRYSVNVPPFHHFTISYLLIFRMELVQLVKLLVGIINLILQLLCTVKQQVTLSMCLNAKPNKCCMFVFFIVFDALNLFSLQHSSASANPYIFRGVFYSIQMMYFIKVFSRLIRMVIL